MIILHGPKTFAAIRIVGRAFLVAFVFGVAQKGGRRRDTVSTPDAVGIQVFYPECPALATSLVTSNRCGLFRLRVGVEQRPSHTN